MLDAWLRGLPEAWTTADEGPETWSAFDVVGHLIHGEEADWIPRARILLAHGEARPFDPFDRFAQQTASRGKTLGALLDTFHDRRNGFNFYTNPLGARADQVVTNEGNPNADWNPVWFVRTGRFDGGWTV